ncbi:MAG: hypothetical protein HKO56_00145, partial [Bacteroidia bacterium]|nr:hypothetical protein [Bacteroidia bacterium]
MNLYKTSIWIPLLAITSVVILYIGYQFNIYDQEDHLPQVYKLLSPELYANDFFVNEYFKSFNVRFFYVSLVYLFSKIIGVYASVTLLHFVCLASTVFLVYKLTIKLGGSHIAGLLAALLLPTAFNTFNLGLSNFVYSSFIAGSIAAPLCIYAFYNYIDNRFIAAAIAAGLACLFQVLMGVQVFLLLSIGMLFKYKEVGMKQIAYAVLAFLLFSGPMLMPMVYQQFLAEKVHDSNLVVQILAYIRNPHHYVPSDFPLESYVKFAFIVVAGLGLLSFLEKKHRETLILFYGVSI